VRRAEATMLLPTGATRRQNHPQRPGTTRHDLLPRFAEQRPASFRGTKNSLRNSEWVVCIWETWRHRCRLMAWDRRRETLSGA